MMHLVPIFFVLFFTLISSQRSHKASFHYDSYNHGHPDEIHDRSYTTSKHNEQYDDHERSSYGDRTKDLFILQDYIEQYYQEQDSTHDSHKQNENHQDYYRQGHQVEHESNPHDRHIEHHQYTEAKNDVHQSHAGYQEKDSTALYGESRYYDIHGYNDDVYKTHSEPEHHDTYGHQDHTHGYHVGLYKTYNKPEHHDSHEHKYTGSKHFDGDKYRDEDHGVRGDERYGNIHSYHPTKVQGYSEKHYDKYYSDDEITDQYRWDYFFLYGDWILNQYSGYSGSGDQESYDQYFFFPLHKDQHNGHRREENPHHHGEHGREENPHHHGEHGREENPHHHGGHGKEGHPHPGYGHGKSHHGGHKHPVDEQRWREEVDWFFEDDHPGKGHKNPKHGSQPSHPSQFDPNPPRSNPPSQPPQSNLNPPPSDPIPPPSQSSQPTSSPINVPTPPPPPPFIRTQTPPPPPPITQNPPPPPPITQNPPPPKPTLHGSQNIGGDATFTTTTETIPTVDPTEQSSEPDNSQEQMNTERDRTNMIIAIAVPLGILGVLTTGFGVAYLVKRYATPTDV